jgi:hypothetical protein
MAAAVVSVDLAMVVLALLVGGLIGIVAIYVIAIMLERISR